MGHSMCGYNVAQTAFRYPETFDKVIILSPSFTTISPYESAEVLEEYASLVLADNLKDQNAYIIFKPLKGGIYKASCRDNQQWKGTWGYR